MCTEMKVFWEEKLECLPRAQRIGVGRGSEGRGTFFGQRWWPSLPSKMESDVEWVFSFIHFYSDLRALILTSFPSLHFFFLFYFPSPLSPFLRSCLLDITFFFFLGWYLYQSSLFQLEIVCSSMSVPTSVFHPRDSDPLSGSFSSKQWEASGS